MCERSRADRVELGLRDVGLPLRAERLEGLLDFLSSLNVLRFLRDHEGHEVLQGDEALAVRVHVPQNRFELGVGLPLLDGGQVVAERAQTALELRVIQPAGPLLVEVPADRYTDIVGTETRRSETTKANHTISNVNRKCEFGT